MVYDPLLELLNCDVPHVELPEAGSSRQTPPKSGSFTHTNVLSKHVALGLQLRHVYRGNIAGKAMQLLEKEVQDGNKERVDLGGPEDPGDQAEMNWECFLQRWITRKTYKGDLGRFIEASVVKEVEFFGTQMIQIILLVATRIAFLITESQGPLVEVFKATPSPSERVVHDTEAKFDLKGLIYLESLLLNPTAGTLRRMRTAKEAMMKLNNFVFTTIEWVFFLSMPAEILEEFVHDVISQETTPHTAELTDFKWAICTGAVCVEHAEYLASARLRFTKQTEDARVTLEQFDLLDPPSATKSQSFSDSCLAKKGNLKKRSAPGDDEFAARKEVKKVALMQQLWTRGLSLDQTFLAASTLNCTILGIRQRSKQSFHLSSVQYAHQQNPPLPLILLAQCLCGFNDAIVRAQQIPDKEQKADDLGFGNDYYDDHNGKDDDSSEHCGVGLGSKRDAPPIKTGGKKSSSHKRQRVDKNRPRIRGATERGLELGESFGQPFPVVDSLENRAYAIDFLSRNNTSAFRMAIFHDIYQSECPAVLECVSPAKVSRSPGESLSDEQGYSASAFRSPDERLRGVSPNVPQSPLLVLTESTEQGARGFTYRGFIPYTDDQGRKRHVRIVAKLAVTDDDQKALFHEARVYDSLDNSNILGIPLIIGLFHDIDDDLYVLVTTDVGLSLSEAAPSKIYGTSDALKSTLSGIHQNGWVHGDLRAPNVSQDSAGRFSIFDFDQAEYIAVSSPERVNQEQLCIDSLLESTADDSECGP